MQTNTEQLKRKTPEGEEGEEERPQEEPEQYTGENQRQEEKKLSPENQPPSKKNKTSHPQPHRPIVELDQSKPTLITKQKPIELSEVSNQIKKTLVAVTEELESSTEQVTDLSPSQLRLIACLVHESDKTLPDLTNYVHSKLLPQAKLLIDDDLSQERFDPLALSVIEAAINQVSRRINYAPVQADLDWLPPNLPKGFQIWRWEANDQETVIPTDLKEISQKRWAERQLIKSQICAILSGLTSSEREALLKKLNPTKRKPKNNVDCSTTKSTHSSKTKLPNGSQEITCVPSSPTTPKPQGSSKETSEKVLTEKELIKQQKDQKRKEKEDARLAEERQKKKMGSLMSGWMTKANNTPKRSNPTCLSDPNIPEDIQIMACFKNGVKQNLNKTPLSDFARTFKPFNLKPNFQLAPINRFRSSDRSNLDSEQSESSGSLTHQECRDQFVKLMRSQQKPTCQRHTDGTFKDKKPMMTVREIVNGIAESELTGCIDGSKKWRKTLQNRSVLPVKFLRFHEDVRPGYIGTWCKTSRLVSGRSPFGKDTCLLDYNYDSEADWNEEDGEGEDLEQSDGGKEDGGSSEPTDSDEDGWLVGDDDEIEMVDDGQLLAGHSAAEPQLDDDLKPVKQDRKIIGFPRRKIVAPLVPVVKGPIWEDTLGVVSNSMFESFRIQMINDAPIGLNPFTYEPKAALKVNRPKLTTVGLKPSPAILPLPGANPPMMTSSTNPSAQTAATTQRRNPEIENQDPGGSIHGLNRSTITTSNHPQTNNFPSELIPELIQFVNGNRKSKPILLEDLKNLFLDTHHIKVSKRSIEQLLGRLAVKVAGTWRIIDPSSTS